MCFVLVGFFFHMNMLLLMAITDSSFLCEEFASDQLIMKRGDSCEETTVLMAGVRVIGPLGQ